MNEVEKLKQDLKDLRAVLEIVKEDRDLWKTKAQNLENLCAVLNKRNDTYLLNNERYEKLRKLNPRQFGDLYEKNIASEGGFDELVDQYVVRGW